MTSDEEQAHQNAILQVVACSIILHFAIIHPGRNKPTVICAFVLFVLFVLFVVKLLAYLRRSVPVLLHRPAAAL